jgi:hypothetical protein
LRHALKSFAPAPISTELHALAEKGTLKPNDLDEAWKRALKKLK